MRSSSAGNTACRGMLRYCGGSACWATSSSDRRIGWPLMVATAVVKDPIVATIHGQPIRLSELEVAQQALPPQYRNMPLQAVFPALLDRIVDSKLVVQDGRKNKVGDDPV